jgi:hypothetical protein
MSSKLAVFGLLALAASRLTTCRSPGEAGGDVDVFHPQRVTRESTRPVFDWFLLAICCLIPLDVGIRRAAGGVQRLPLAGGTASKRNEPVWQAILRVTGKDRADQRRRHRIAVPGV